MAKTKISEFSTTPGNNTDINGINIAEGCAPSGINNAIRELMSDLKEWQSGAMDVYVIPQGTAAAPGIQLYGDLDTGLYGYAANQLGVAVGGASAGYFSSAGWVGNVNGTITGDINATTIDTTNLEVTNIKAKDGTAAITIADSTGVVSVSTTLDLTTVEVTNIKAKDGTAAIALTDSTGVVTLARTTSATNSVNEMLVLEHYSTGTISAGFGSGIKFFGENTSGGNSVYAAIHAVWEGGIGDPSGGALVFLTDGYVGDNTERVRITSEGKVGIGTATPSATLEVAGSATVTGATTLSATTQNIALGTSQTTGTWTAGGASQTGALTLDQSTKTHTLNLGTGATESGLTKTINLGTGGVSTSTTAITIGSANGTSTTLNGTVTAATLNSTTIDTTNIEVTNIKAKDGSASATIADSTGVMTIASSVLTTTDINGGTIDGTTIGGSTAAAGTFTTATATTGNITTVNATTVDTTNLEVTNIKAKDGTAALSIADSTGAVTVATALTANGGAVFNENGADVDFRVEGDTDANLIFADASTDRVGIGTNGPVNKLQINPGALGGGYSGINASGADVYFEFQRWSGAGSNFGATRITGSTASGNGYLSFSNSNETTIGAQTFTERMRIAPGGMVNIGGNFGATGATLQVTGNAAIGYTAAAPTYGLIVAGNVGIGTNSVTSGYGLEVSGAGVRNSATTPFIDIYATGQGANAKWWRTGGGGADYTVTAINDAGTASDTALRITRSGSSIDSIRFSTSSTERMRLDSSGNLGLGVTPSAWNAGANFEINGNTGNLVFRTIATIGENWYFNGAYKYIANGYAEKYEQYLGKHIWYTAPSGTAGTINATALTSTQNGNSYTILTAGTTDFTLIGAANNNVGTTFTKSGGTGAGTGTVTQNITFTQAMTLDASGNLLVGDTSTNDNATLFVRRAGATVGATTYTLGWFQNATGYKNGLAIKATDNAVTIAADFAGSAGGAAALVFATNSTTTANNATERARITSGGLVQVSSGGSVQIGGTAARATTAGTNRLDIFNGTAPVGTLSNGISIYSSSGEAYVMDAAGNATLFSPHDAETNEWIFKSKHTPTGKTLKIDVEKLLRFINDHFGLDAVHEFIEE